MTNPASLRNQFESGEPLEGELHTEADIRFNGRLCFLGELASQMPKAFEQLVTKRGLELVKTWIDSSDDLDAIRPVLAHIDNWKQRRRLAESDASDPWVTRAAQETLLAVALCPGKAEQGRFYLSPRTPRSALELFPNSPFQRFLHEEFARPTTTHITLDTLKLGPDDEGVLFAEYNILHDTNSEVIDAVLRAVKLRLDAYLKMQHRMGAAFEYRPYRATKTDEHMRWLVWRQSPRGMTWAAVAEKAGRGESVVRDAVPKAADLIGLEIKRNQTNRRLDDVR